ncbi:MAG: FAD binding domain-containing protein [Thermoleophilia bacterium]|nr:FAD binding domain-containing protein [Thermoleophilia bacterium]
MEATLTPTTLAEALEMRAAHPGSVPIAGGTDLMVELNFDRRRPERLLDLTRVPELAELGRDDGAVHLGAGVTYTGIVERLGAAAPALAIASRTVGSPQIRNRGTVGGNLGTASPAGDALPPLVASGASVEVASARGRRTVAAADFCVGPKRNVLDADELIVAVDVPAARGPQQFAKVGVRNAMVIAVCSFALAVDARSRRVTTAIGSAAPTVVSAPEAEAFLAGALDERDGWDRPARLGEAELARFGDLVAAAARPIDDVRGTVAYRRHALAVLARRALDWAWTDYARSWA